MLTVVGDANDIATWSGIPYFLLRAGKRRGFLDGGVSLRPQGLAPRRVAWNLRSLWMTGEFGGYQFTQDFLSRLFAQARLPETEPLELVTHFQLLPPRPWGSAWKVVPYIDATFKQLFEDYGLSARVSRAVREDALARERDAYHAAERVVCMCQWAADSVVGEYGVSRDKCHVVAPGPNLVEEEIGVVDAESGPMLVDGPLRLGFVGKEWQRKGLPLVLEIADELTRRGVRCEVVVIGPDPAALPRHPLIRAHGFLDKHREMGRFVDLIRSFHFGCLLSSAEAVGFSVLECLRLGVPVVGMRVGAIGEWVHETLGLTFAPTCSIDEIVTAVERYAKDPDEYTALRRRVAARAGDFSWDRAVTQLSELFDSPRVQQRGNAGA